MKSARVGSEPEGAEDLKVEKHSEWQHEEKRKQLVSCILN
jgi:hypothetical protein